MRAGRAERPEPIIPLSTLKKPIFPLSTLFWAGRGKGGIQGDLRTPLCCPEICSRDSLLTSGPWRFKPVLSLLRLLSDLTVRKGSGITRRGCDILH